MSAHSGVAIWRVGMLSLAVPRRPLWVGAGLVVVLMIAVPLAVATGAGGLTPISAALGLLGFGDDMQLLLARELRFPRVLAALVIGAALAAGGCLLQTLARNRLATPAILGINEGATLAVLLSVVLSPAATLGPWWVAPLGALAAAMLLFLCAGDMGARGYRILLVGVALSALLRSSVELGLSLAALQHASAIYAWSLGSLIGQSVERMRYAGLAIAALLPLAVVLGRRLSLLQFDLESAASLGLSVRFHQWLALLLAVALSGLAVGIAGPVGGPVGFVALASPIIARRLAATPVVPVVLSALVGALLVLGADTLGRVIAAPAEVPAGAITSIVGGPFVLWVLFSQSDE